MREGFTLIEILICLGIAAILLAAGLEISLNTYRLSLLSNEENLLMAILNRARIEASNNFDNQTRGVLIEENDYILFSGETFTEGDEDNTLIKRNSNIAVSTDQNPILFHPLSGQSMAAEISLSDNASSREINLDPSGRLDY